MEMGRVDRQRSVAVYQQVRELLEQEITKSYHAGDLLPSEISLAQRFGVNRHTLRRTVDGLISGGFVERVHGKGTLVLEHSVDYLLGPHTRFTETLNSLGRHTRTHILQKKQIKASEGVNKRLNLSEGSNAVFIETMREVDGKPFCLISHFLPVKPFISLLTEYQHGSLHNYIKSTYNNKLQRSESLISAVSPQEYDAGQLRMPRHLPVLRVKSLNVDASTGRPVEYAVTRFRGDAVQLNVAL